MAFFELRQYKVRPGRMEDWLGLMEDEIIPFQVSKGMDVIASFQGETDDSLYFWIRRFESEAERERLYEAVYETDFWKNEMAPVVRGFLDTSQSVIQRVVPTFTSPMQ